MSIPISVSSNKLTIRERIEIVDLYFKNECNAAKVAKVFNNEHSQRPRIWKSTVCRLIRKFQQTGSVCDKKSTGRRRTATSDISIFNLLDRVEASPMKSIRKLAQECNTSRSTVHRILQENKYRPYKVKHLQMLHAGDTEKRMRFCDWFLNHGEVSLTLFSDEAVFYLNGNVLKPHYWATANQNQYMACRSQQKSKLVVWAGIIGSRIIGPYFFEGNVTGKMCFC